jgi:hypothetical protein
MTRFRSILALSALVLLAVGVTASRSEVVQNESVDFTGFTVFIPCADGGAGELVVFEGNLHVLITSTVNGQNVSAKAHFQPQGLSGVGQTTGDKYQATGVTQDHQKSSLQNGQASFTFVNNFRIIGQGPGNNFLVHQVVHVTVNANGDTTADHDRFTVDCK